MRHASPSCVITAIAGLLILADPAGAVDVAGGTSASPTDITAHLLANENVHSTAISSSICRRRTADW